MPTLRTSQWKRWPRTAGVWSSWTWQVVCGSETSPSGMLYFIFKRRLIAETPRSPIPKLSCLLCSQDSSRILPKAAVPEGESLSQRDRVEPRSSAEAQCSDWCRATFTEGPGASSRRAGVCPFYQPSDLGKGEYICPTGTQVRMNSSICFVVYHFFIYITNLLQKKRQLEFNLFTIRCLWQACWQSFSCFQYVLYFVAGV